MNPRRGQGPTSLRKRDTQYFMYCGFNRLHIERLPSAARVIHVRGEKCAVGPGVTLNAIQG